MRLILVFSALLSAASLLAQPQNILISTESSPNEPSICLDPRNPAHIVGGANLNNVYVSSDTGKTWSHQFLSSSYGVWGDPVIGVDTAGHFLFLHLSNPPQGSWIDRIVCQKSVNGGQTWSTGTFMGLNGTRAQDKHWIAVDPATNTYYVTWTQFDVYGTSNPQDSSRILFSRSTDGGETWSPAKRINKISGDCVDSDETVEGAVPCVGPNGEVYVAWAGPQGLVFDRSTDGGNTWLANDIKIGDFPGGWDYNIPGIYRCNGLPVTACDLSGGPHHGTIYVNWTDQRNGATDTDVWLAKSTDGGDIWSAPIRVNDDPAGRQQFFTWMAVDQANGRLWFVFYDRRNYTNNNTDVYMAVSDDGGATFQNFRISESSFSPSSQAFFGDYTNVTVHNNIVRPIWCRMDNVNSSIWTALVDGADYGSSATHTPAKADNPLSLQQNFPNPADEETWIPFKVHNRTTLTLQILDEKGNVRHTVFENRVYNYGKYIEHVPMREAGLPAGNYWIMLSGDGKTVAKKMAVVK